MQAKGLVTQMICIIFLAHRCDHRAHLLVLCSDYHCMNIYCYEEFV